jgi:uncharacterized protein YbjT (DUF2867 family)
MQEGKILVAGATGRVGGAAVRHLLEAGYEVRALVRSARKGEPLRALGAEVFVGDVTRTETLAPALEGCAGVFSALSAATDREAVEVEYGGNVNLLSAARGGRIIVLHPPLSAARLAGRFSAPVEELANMFALFDAAGYATDPTPLQDVFGVRALSIEEWARLVSG